MFLLAVGDWHQSITVLHEATQKLSSQINSSRNKRSRAAGRKSAQGVLQGKVDLSESNEVVGERKSQPAGKQSR